MPNWTGGLLSGPVGSFCTSPQTKYFSTQWHCRFPTVALIKEEQTETKSNLISIQTGPHRAHITVEFRPNLGFWHEKNKIFLSIFVFFLPQEVQVLQQTFSSWKMLATKWRNCRWCQWSAHIFSRHSMELQTGVVRSLGYWVIVSKPPPGVTEWPDTANQETRVFVWGTNGQVHHSCQ